MSSAINSALSSLTGTSPAAQTPASGNPSTDPLANESTFLTLLVSQLQNQDPLNPVDSTQFVSQLTSYSQLEQLIGIHQNTTTLASAAPGTSASSGTAPTSTTAGSSAKPTPAA